MAVLTALGTAATAIGTAATSIGISGLATAAAVAGAGVSAYGQYQSQQAQQRSIAAQRRAEALRQSQMRLEADRRRREIIRNATIARSTSLANMSAAGAQFGTALSGARAGLFQQEGQQLTAVDQNLQIGEGMFDANMDLFSANAANARAQGLTQMGTTIGNLDTTLVNNMPAISRLGQNMGFGAGDPRSWVTTTYGAGGQVV